MIEAKQVTVIGSLNLDSFTRVDSLPKPGETVVGTNLQLFRGGKGANQAIAAVRQGCKVALIGAVGRERAGKAYREALQTEGIHISNIRQTKVPTGAAYITVDREHDCHRSRCEQGTQTVGHRKRPDQSLCERRHPDAI